MHSLFYDISRREAFWERGLALPAAGEQLEQEAYRGPVEIACIAGGAHGVAHGTGTCHTRMGDSI